MIYLYYLSPISKGSWKVTASYATSRGKQLMYGMDDTNLATWKIVFGSILVINSTVDALSSVLLIMLLKQYSSNQYISYAKIDGWVRVFTNATAISWIKYSPFLSMYSSGGRIVTTLSFSVILYLMIQGYNIYMVTIHKVKGN